MSINIRTDFMQHAELFGNPVLFTNWLIQRDTIPKDWYCYDLRGTRQSPNVKIALVDKTARYHAGTVLSPTPLKRKETASRRVNSAFHLLGEEMTLEQFCEEHSLEYALTANGDEAVHRMEQVWELFRGAVAAEHAERRQTLLEEADIQMDELCGCLDPEAEVEDGKQLLTWEELRSELEGVAGALEASEQDAVPR